MGSGQMLSVEESVANKRPKSVIQAGIAIPQKLPSFNVEQRSHLSANRHRPIQPRAQKVPWVLLPLISAARLYATSASAE